MAVSLELLEELGKPDTSKHSEMGHMIVELHHGHVKRQLPLFCRVETLLPDSRLIVGDLDLPMEMNCGQALIGAVESGAGSKCRITPIDSILGTENRLQTLQPLSA